ncbi:glycosyl hydrolase family 8 [Anaerosporobacter faecicola]|uniref:glycosyl hydrolase family 8 n=1 Tax=Anaerosporobacter faecicola TaxID=2718714 RepID=UPI00143B893D|nr:glycosyl hydrolase family 8 [Anaerosporobacter faecicola]
MVEHKVITVRNLFEEAGIPKKEIEQRLEEIFQTIFYGTKEERFYEEVGMDMGYLTDTGNHDVRTEGMSYGMMMCVQLDKKEEFDRIWKWAKTYMWNAEGRNKGYFAWSCSLDGRKNATGPAPDGEEYFAMALFFASHRWGDGDGIFQYTKEAKALLRECIHKGEKEDGSPMWDPTNHLIKFVPGCDFTDPSYHLPHFYELFALWAEEEDRAFWKKAAACSRAYLKKACHPITGLCAEYAEYDGTPHREKMWHGERHDLFYSDAYRTALNIGLDYAWFGADSWECDCAGKIQTFFQEHTKLEQLMTYEIDGREIEEPARHPVALIATTAAASLASVDCKRTETEDYGRYAMEWVKTFYHLPLRTGDRRYYDNCLYLFAFLALSGKYQIW